MNDNTNVLPINPYSLITIVATTRCLGIDFNRGGSRGRWHCSGLRSPESYDAPRPVNQWIVLAEPLVSDNKWAVRVQQSYEEFYKECFTSGEDNWHFHFLCDESVVRPIQ